MRVHAYHSLAHYGDHLHEIWRHLPSEIRGEFVQTRFIPKADDPADVIMVAGFGDIKLARQRRVVFVEHGAGQRYVDLPEKADPYYGGPYPPNVIAYLGPRQSCVDSTGLPGFAMGAPICDPYELFGEEKVCAFTWHWKARRVCPEADSALNYYVDWLPTIVKELQADGWEVLGHRHPRLTSAMGMWRKLGIVEVTAEIVRRRASLLFSDNTSLAYEMAYTLRNNIVLNAPWYRRDVEHGLRFWDNPPGAMFDSSEDLLDNIHDLPMEVPDIEAVYGRTHSDGNDGLRAAAWLTRFLATL